jgi:hypothetical protein
MDTKSKWQLVKEKQEELSRLTEDAWQKGEWELAALGERTMQTVAESITASEEMNNAMTSLNHDIDKLRESISLNLFHGRN